MIPEDEATRPAELLDQAGLDAELAALAEVAEQVRVASDSSAARLGSRPVPLRPGDDRYVGLAAEVGRSIGERAAHCDAEDRFPFESYDELRASGYLGLPVPEALGGCGATVRQLCYAEAELARHCGATALGVAMHLHVALTDAWRWRRGDDAAGAVLERVAKDGLVLMSTIGTDGVFPSGLALADGDGYRVSGRKRMCSGAPGGGLVSSSAFSGEYERGAVIEFRCPLPTAGAQVVETWRAMGMRASGSHDLELSDVWVPADQVQRRRQWGQIDDSIRLTLLHMNPLTSAVYYGIAASTRDVAVAHTTSVNRGPRFIADMPEARRQVGLMEYGLRTAWWSLAGSLDQIGEDPEPDAANLAIAGLARRCAVLHTREVVDLAMDIVGGSSYLRSSPLERAHRDIRAAPFHSPSPEVALSLAGKVAVGRGCHHD